MNKQPKYNIHEWSPDHTKRGKGITLIKDEQRKLEGERLHMLRIRVSRLGIEQKNTLRSKLIKLLIYAIIGIVVSIISYQFFIYIEGMLREHISLNGEGSINAWVSSLGSYWGGILGGAVSGIIALGGTFIVINYYRKSDLENRRLTNNPFIYIEVLKQQTQPFESKELFELGKGNMQIYVEINIKNIGKNFAQTLAYYDGSNCGGKEFRHTIESGSRLDANYNIKLNHEKNFPASLKFSLMVMDCFSNEYIQTYEIYVEENKTINISCNYPVLTLASLK
jgi:hypothetical protein